MDGIYLRRNWGGEFENVAILVAIAVNEDGYREVLGAAEGMKEDKASWVSFFQWLRGRGLDGVKLVVGDKCLGMLELWEKYSQKPSTSGVLSTSTQCVLSHSSLQGETGGKNAQAIHAQESKRAAREKAKAVVEQLRSMKLKEAARKVRMALRKR